MEIKLKSVLKTHKQRLLLAVRALIFAGALWLLALGEVSLLRIVAFCAIATLLYLQPVFRTTSFLASYIALALCATFTMTQFGPQVPIPFVLALVLAGLFYILLGLKHLVFQHQQQMYRLLQGTLLYLVCVLFFSATTDGLLILRQAVFFIVIFLLSKEQFAFAALEQPKRGVGALVSAFAALQLTWAASLLPFGFIQAAGAVFVVVFGVQEVLILSEKKHSRLTYGGVLGAVLVLLGVIAFSTRWTLA